MMLAWKVAPAIACGNAVVVKSAEQTPLSALYFGKLVQEAGAPPGLINILSGYGKEAGAALAEHLDVDKVAFTGSTATGRTIMKAASANLKNITLECGGKSPSIVFADANLEQAVKWTHSGGISSLFFLFLLFQYHEQEETDISPPPPLFGLVGLFNQGEVCTATTRIYVEESIHDQFVEEFIKYTKSTSTVGHPFDEATFQGPQVSQAQYEKVLDFIEVGKQEGAKVEMGGGAFKAGKEGGGGGYFIEPTVFSNVSSLSPLSPLQPPPLIFLPPLSKNPDLPNHAHRTRRNLRPGNLHQQIPQHRRSHPARQRQLLRSRRGGVYRKFTQGTCGGGENSSGNGLVEFFGRFTLGNSVWGL